MTTLAERLNLSVGFKESNRSDAVSFDYRQDINIYETLTLYCSEHNIDLNNISDDDFNGCEEVINDFRSGCVGDNGNIISFWIDKK